MEEGKRVAMMLEDWEGRVNTFFCDCSNNHTHKRILRGRVQADDCGQRKEDYGSYTSVIYDMINAFLNCKSLFSKDTSS